jgi:tRNA(adenine34) deaminase
MKVGTGLLLSFLSGQSMSHDYFMNLALVQAEEALNKGEFPVGCVIVLNDKLVSSGKRTGTVPGMVNETDHAEMNALRGISASFSMEERKNMSLYCTLEPCLMCFSAIMLTGIGRIIYAYEDAMGGGTSVDLASAAPLYAELRPEVISGVMRNKSLDLFRAFFSAPDNQYWKNSLLEKYTLSQ